MCMESGRIPNARDVGKKGVPTKKDAKKKSDGEIAVVTNGG